MKHLFTPQSTSYKQGEACLLLGNDGFLLLRFRSMGCTEGGVEQDADVGWHRC